MNPTQRPVRGANRWNRLLPLLAAGVIALAGCKSSKQEAAAPQGAGTAGAIVTQASWAPDVLEQLVAPIALYPDELVGLVLAASINSQEVMDAGNWLIANPDLKGDKLDAEAKKAGFGEPMQGLVRFPTVVDMMCREFDWTKQLGSAFTSDQKGVLDAIQRLRSSAMSVGNLQSTPQQTVQETTEDGAKVIAVKAADPKVVYVPVYDPQVVFTAPPPAPTTTVQSTSSGTNALLAFGVGIMVGVAMSNSYCYPHYGAGCVYVGPRPYYPPAYAYHPAYPPAHGYHPPAGYQHNYYNQNNVNINVNNNKNYYNQFNNNANLKGGAARSPAATPTQAGARAGGPTAAQTGGKGTAKAGGQAGWKGQSSYAGAKPGAQPARTPGGQPGVSGTGGAARAPSASTGAMTGRTAPADRGYGASPSTQPSTRGSSSYAGGGSTARPSTGSSGYAGGAANTPTASTRPSSPSASAPTASTRPSTMSTSTSAPRQESAFSGASQSGSGSFDQAASARGRASTSGSSSYSGASQSSSGYSGASRSSSSGGRSGGGRGR